MQLQVIEGHLILIKDILLITSTTKQAKRILYPGKLTFDCHIVTKCPRSIGVIFFHRSRSWKDLLYVCKHGRACNFFLIATKCDTQVGLINTQVNFEY